MNQKLTEIETVDFHQRGMAEFIGLFPDPQGPNLVEVEYNDGSHDTFGKWNFIHAINRGEVEIIE